MSHVFNLNPYTLTLFASFTGLAELVSGHPTTSEIYNIANHKLATMDFLGGPSRSFKVRWIKPGWNLHPTHSMKLEIQELLILSGRTKTSLQWRKFLYYTGLTECLIH